MTKDQLIETITGYFNEHIPFNVLLGIQVKEVSKEQVTMQLQMKPELIGNTFQEILHGGVTASILDVAGGMAALVNAIHRLTEIDPMDIERRLRKVGTIDMRVDYLRPGHGKTFTATAEVLRHGQSIAVTRMTLHNEKQQNIAVGTATYFVG